MITISHGMRLLKEKLSNLKIMECKVISHQKLTDNYPVWPSMSDDHSTPTLEVEKQEHLSRKNVLAQKEKLTLLK